MLKNTFLFFALTTPFISYGILGSHDLLQPSQEEIEKRKKKDYEDLLNLVNFRIAHSESLDEPIEKTWNKPPLLKATSYGDEFLPITKLILNNGGNPNITFKFLNEISSPLGDAIKTLSIKTVELLLIKKATPKIRIDKRTALEQICWSLSGVEDSQTFQKRFKIATYLLEAGVKRKKSLCFHYLFKADPKLIDDNDRELFLYQRKALIKLIIDYGGALATKDETGQTAIERAKFANNPYSIELANYAVKYRTFFNMIDKIRKGKSFLSYLPRHLVAEIGNYMLPPLIYE